MTKKSLSILVFVILLALGCRKTEIDQSEEVNKSTIAFFDSKKIEDPDVLLIIQKLQLLNSNKEFVSKIQKFGNPIWDKVLIQKLKKSGNSYRVYDQDSIVIIPIADEYLKIVTAMLVSTIHNGEYSFQLMLLQDYESYSSNEMDFIKGFAALDHKVYSAHKDYKIDPSLIISDEIGVLKLKPLTPAAGEDEDPCDIIEIWYNPSGSNDDGDEINTGEWYYAGDCNESAPVPPVVVLWGIGGGNNGLIYTLPDLGGLSTGQGFNPFPYTPNFSPDEMLHYLTEQLNLDPTLEAWLQSNQQHLSFLFNSLYGHFTIQLRDRLLIAIKYLKENPSTSDSDLDNWFLGSEYIEPETDPLPAGFWDDPNLNIPPQTLPSMSSLRLNYPVPDHGGPNDNPVSFYNSLGGQLLADVSPVNLQTNTCAARLSDALLKCGITIPNIPSVTHKAANGKYYFTAADQMGEWMKRTFGTPSSNPNNVHVYNNAQGGSNGNLYPSLLQNSNGLYLLLPMSQSRTVGFGATGHVDVISNGNCQSGHCYFSATGGVYQIWVWDCPQ
jgi:hypothetical protein